MFLVESLVGIYKNQSKINFESNFGQILSKPVKYLTYNKFGSKLSKNAHFSLNKVCKMINKRFFPIKYEMSTAYGFHIDFKFRDQKSLPRDFQMVMASP